MEITLEEFLKQERDRLNRFETYWKENQQKEGKGDWPDRMLPGDWDEQVGCTEEVEGL